MILEHTSRAQALEQAEEIRNEIRKDAKWFRDKKPEIERRWMKLASNCYIVQKFNLWRDWESKITGQKFKTFAEWITEEADRSRSQVYTLIDIVESLPMSAEEMGDLGQRNCHHLAVLARTSPGKLKGVIAEVRNTPDIREKDVRNLVYSAMEGEHVQGGRYEYLEFAMKKADAKIVDMALKVMQERDRLDHPNNPTGRGRHLVLLATEWLQDPEQVEIMKKLRKTGVIDAGEVEFDESE